MNTADKMAALCPGKKWRIVYDKNGGESLEWEDAGPKPNLAAVRNANIPQPKSVREELDELRARIEALESRP